MIEGHGDDLWRYGGKIKHNFSTNIHSAFDHSPLMERLGKCLGAVVSYPEPEPQRVERKIAGMNGLKASEVMVTNGATEAIYEIAGIFSGRSSSIMSPTFREYQDACSMYGHEITFFDTITNLPSTSDLVWICNPNNPTGLTIDREELLETIHRNSDKIFIIDQAYSDYTLKETLSYKDAVSNRNVIILGSLTKRFAVPGLRIGYAIGCEEIIAQFKRRRMPWSVGGLSIEGALYLLQNIDRYQIDATTMHNEALRIKREFENLGITVTSSDCNFILCKLPEGTSAELKDYLAETAGILIRDASNFEGLGPRHFRIAAQSAEENNLLINEIKKWLNI